MAQVIKLKRTAVQGKIPTTSQLDLGELAINTYDGRIFFEKDDGTPSIQEILTTNSNNSGSFNLTGAISASSFVSSSDIHVDGVLRIAENGSGLRMTNVGAFDNSNGSFRIFSTGDLILSTNGDSGTAVTFSSSSKDATFQGNIIGTIASDNGVISGSSQISDLGYATTGSNTFVDGQLILDERGGSNYSLTVGANSTGDRFHVLTNNTAGAGIILTSKNNNNTSDQKLSFSGSAFEFGGGDVNILGNLTLGGNITIGDSTTDSISVTADFSSSLIPDIDNTFDLGSSSKKWRNSYIGTASADYFVGDGSGLTNLNVDVGETATVTSSFDNVSSISITHSFDSRNVLISVYDTNYAQIIPQSVTLTSNSVVDIVLSSAHSGHVVVAKGGHIVSGSITQIDEVASINDTFTNQTSYTVNHTFETKNVFVTVYGTDDEQIIPATVSTPTTSSVVLGFDDATSGRVVVGKAGHIVSGSVIADFNQLTNKPSGLVSGSSQLTSSFDTRYALSGSSGTSDFTQLTNVPSGLVSGSTQITNGSGLVSGSSQIEFNSVNNTPFSQSASSVTTTKSIIPTTSTIDLGTSANPFRDLYLSSASLYIDGTQVVSSDATTLTFTTDTGQSIKLLETGADDIILQTDTGNIELKGTVEILTGKKITDSAGTKIEFGDSLGITGSIDLTGTVDGIDLQSFSSSVATSLSNVASDWDSVTSKPSGLVSSSDQVTSSLDSRYVNVTGTETIGGDKTFSDNVVVTGNLTVQGTTTTIDSTTVNIGDNILELNYGGSATTSGILTTDATGGSTTSGSLLWDATNDYWKAGTLGSESEVITTSNIVSNLPTGTISGSSQVTITESQISDLSHYTNSDVLTYINSLSVVSGSVSSYTDSDNTNHLNSLGVVSGSTSYTQTFTAQTEVTASHNLGTKNVTVSVYGSDDYMIFPTSIKTHDTNNVYVGFNTSRSGRIVITK